MTPDIRDGKRVVLDPSDRMPAASGTFLFRNGDGMALRRVEAVDEDGPPRLGPIPTNPGCAS